MRKMLAPMVMQKKLHIQAKMHQNGSMDKPIDLLSRVANELERRKGNLARISEDTEISYDTLRRIKDRAETDTGYGKVRRLYEYLFHTTLEEVPAEAREA